MRSLLFSVTVFVASFVPNVLAYGERGVAERILYWMAYLAEEQILTLDSGYTLTVAPGCVGSRAGGRCTLDELLMYIWAPDVEGKDTTPPKTVSPSTGIKDQISFNFNQFFGKIQNAKFDGKVEVTGDIDSKKLSPGAEDYYTALSKMGEPIDKLSQVCMQAVAAAKAGGPAFKISSFQRKIWDWGKDSAFLVSALRRKDLDKYRAEFFKKYFETNRPEGFSGDFNPQMINIETAMKNTNIPAIDFTATINEYEPHIPDIADRLKAGNDAYMAITRNGQFFNAVHQKALDAAQTAVTACKCDRKYPTSLKRKRSLVEAMADKIQHRAPKAARSMRMKARKLGLVSA